MYMQTKELDKTIGFNNEKVTELASTPILFDLNLVKSVFVGCLDPVRSKCQNFVKLFWRQRECEVN